MRHTLSITGLALLAWLASAAPIAAAGPATATGGRAPASGGAMAALAAGQSAAAPADSGDAETVEDTVRRTLRGRIASEASGAYLPFALVEVIGDRGIQVTLADDRGRYSIAGLTPGVYQVRASALDHEPLEIGIRVPENGGLVVDLGLELRPIELPGITVMEGPGRTDTVAGAPRPAPLRGSPADPELRALESTPGAAELGLVDAVRGEPNPDPLDPSGILYVRGAASDLKLVLLDGAPVYAPFHLGGLMNAVQPGVLRDARLYVGGAPARYDGGLSHILDLETRAGRPDESGWSGALDLLGARTRIEGPLGSGSYLVSGRTLHGSAADQLAGERLPYGYREALGRFDIGLGGLGDPWGLLSVTGFHNRETVDLHSASGLRDPAYWGNTAASVRYGTHLGAAAARVGAALGEFSTRLPLGDTLAWFAHARSRRLRLFADAETEAAGLRLAFGAAYDRHQLQYRADRRPVATGTATEYRQGSADAVGLYGDATWGIVPELEIRGGLRANVFMPGREVRLAPRLSAIWSLSEHSRLSLAGGRYYQFLRSSETLLSSDLGESWTGPLEPTADERGAPRMSLPLFAVAGASHLVMGLDHDASEDLHLGLEAFYKYFDYVESIRGLQASGVDLWIDWRKGHWAAWGGYSLAWVWTDGNREPTDRFSSRQLISGALRVPLPSGVRLDLELASSSGIPFTPVPTGPPGRSSAPVQRQFVSASSADPLAESGVAGAPDGSYLRLDARVSRAWATRLLGVPFRITPYAGILNALDRRDALFYQFNADRDLRPRSLEAVPMLPIAGIEWEL